MRAKTRVVTKATRTAAMRAKRMMRVGVEKMRVKRMMKVERMKGTKRARVATRVMKVEKMKGTTSRDCLRCHRLKPR